MSLTSRSALYTRQKDAKTFTYIGSDNQYYNRFAVVIPQVANRALSGPLLGGQTYWLKFVAPKWNPRFYPQSVTLDMNDRGAPRHVHGMLAVQTHALAERDKQRIEVHFKAP